MYDILILVKHTHQKKIIFKQQLRHYRDPIEKRAYQYRVTLGSLPVFIAAWSFPLVTGAIVYGLIELMSEQK